MAAPPAPNAPPDLSDCEAIEWDTSPELTWSWERLLSRLQQSQHGEWSHQQRIFVQNPALYYSNQSVREKGDMQDREQWMHAAECMQTTAAPGTILLFRDVCGFTISAGLSAAQLGRTSSVGERGLAQLSRTCHSVCCSCVWIRTGRSTAVTGISADRKNISRANIALGRCGPLRGRNFLHTPDEFHAFKLHVCLTTQRVWFYVHSKPVHQDSGGVVDKPYLRHHLGGRRPTEGRHISATTRRGRQQQSSKDTCGLRLAGTAARPLIKGLQTEPGLDIYVRGTHSVMLLSHYPWVYICNHQAD